MGTKEDGAEEAVAKALGWICETDGRAARRMAERRIYFVSTHGNGGWSVEAGGARRATHVRKTKGQAVLNGKELARSSAPSQLLA